MTPTLRLRAVSLNLLRADLPIAADLPALQPALMKLDAQRGGRQSELGCRLWKRGHGSDEFDLIEGHPERDPAINRPDADVIGDVVVLPLEQVLDHERLALALSLITAALLLFGFLRPVDAASYRTGQATWYCCTRGYSANAYVAAAGPALRIGHWRGRYVWVSSGTRRIRVRLVDYCRCSWGRVIDLHPGPFRALAPLSRGVVKVRVTW